MSDTAPTTIREFGGIRVHRTHWPIIVLEFPEKRIADTEFHDALEYVETLMRECQRSGQKSFQVTDLTRIREIAPASQRRYAGEWVKEMAPLIRVASIGGADVTPSSILRGLITAIHWIQRPPTPTAVFATRSEAYLHAIGELERALGALPPNLGALRKHLQAQSVGQSSRPAGP
jgi:hypothetical protein